MSSHCLSVFQSISISDWLYEGVFLSVCLVTRPVIFFSLSIFFRFLFLRKPILTTFYFLRVWKVKKETFWFSKFWDFLKKLKLCKFNLQIKIESNLFCLQDYYLNHSLLAMNAVLSNNWLLISNLGGMLDKH